MTAPAKRERAAQRSQRYHVIAVGADGRRCVALASSDRREADAYVNKNRAFARAAGGDVFVEPAFLVRVTVPAAARWYSDEDRAA